MSQLQGEQSQAQTQVTAEQNAVAQNAQAIQSQKSALAQEQGQIATLVQQQQQAEAAAAAKAAQHEAGAQQLPPPRRQSHLRALRAAASAVAAGLSQAAPPPTSPGGAGAVQAAESQIGVPYVWGGESPKGSASPGFDCSGLTAWSWGQVGRRPPPLLGSPDGRLDAGADQRPPAG